MEFLIQFGYLGLFTAAFLAATILPFSSEIVLSALILGGLDPVLLVAVATCGKCARLCDQLWPWLRWRGAF